MPIASTDLLLFSAANRTEDDTATAGGAIDTQYRPMSTEMGANAVAAIVSDGADTRNVTVTGRLANGAIDSETLALNGTTEVVGTKTFERLLKVAAASTSGSRTITVKQGSGGATLETIPPNEIGRHRHFYGSVSDPSLQKVRYDKDFWKNNHGTLALTSAAVKLTADPAAKIKIGLAASKGDTATATNRLTAPGGITFSDDNVSLSVPTGQLAAAETIGVWIEQTLAAANAPVKSSFTTELSGQTT